MNAKEMSEYTMDGIKRDCMVNIQVAAVNKKNHAKYKCSDFNTAWNLKEWLTRDGYVVSFRQHQWNNGVTLTIYWKV